MSAQHRSSSGNRSLPCGDIAAPTALRGAQVGTVAGMKAHVLVLAASAVLLVGCAADGTRPIEPQGQSSPLVVTPGPSTAQTADGPTAVPTTKATTAAAPTAAPPTTEPAPAPGTTITTAGSEFGEVLFDGAGQAIYLFDQEPTATPVCYDECAVAWPPVLTDGTPVAAEGVDADALGTTPRTDGSVQVTYGGHPLYFYAHEGPNEVRCHNVRGFDGLWFALSPAGEAAPF